MSDAIFARRSLSTLKIRRCVAVMEVSSAPAPLTLRLLMSRLAQSFRLMVGVQDYPTYLRHMHQQHPGTKPMTEKEFHRYCLDARFPSQAGKLGKCPC
ncbi:CstA-like transporter-associated (seleno)protein [Erwinia sp. P6884]|uniref:YbdD/YjiX family protein n=1 Tax=Erwinia sp. P6884 TaxID=3141450 RepID=UPI003186C3AF